MPRARFSLFSTFRLADLPAVQNAPAGARAFAADFRMQDGVRAEENRKNAADFDREASPAQNIPATDFSII